MRLSFQHPAIVAGTAADGRSRHDVVRVTSEFDIAEMSGDDSLVSFEYSDFGSLPWRIRTTPDGRHFKPLNLSAFQGINEGTFVHSALVAGTGFDFHSIGQDIASAARAIGLETGCNVGNLDKPITRRERGKGLTRDGNACLSAPLLKNWRWLSADVDARVSHWRDIVAEKLENLVSIDGTLHIRCFEPCTALVVTQGKAERKLLSRGVYQQQVHKKEFDHEGLLVMGTGAMKTLTHYFSALEPTGAADLAATFGWKVGKSAAFLTAVDPTLVSDDFHEMETMRYARMVYATGREVANFFARRLEDYPQHGQLAASFDAANGGLKEGLLKWQDGEATQWELEAAMEPFRELFAAFPDLREERYAPSVSETITAIDQFAHRGQDAAISIDAISPRL